MAQVKTTDVSHIRFTSTVFPTAEDRALWKSLSDQQRHALIEKSEQAGFDSCVAERVSLYEILSEVRAEATNEV